MNPSHRWAIQPQIGQHQRTITLKGCRARIEWSCPCLIRVWNHRHTCWRKSIRTNRLKRFNQRPSSYAYHHGNSTKATYIVNPQFTAPLSSDMKFLTSHMSHGDSPGFFRDPSGVIWKQSQVATRLLRDSEETLNDVTDSYWRKPSTIPVSSPKISGSGGFSWRQKCWNLSKN